MSVLLKEVPAPWRKTVLTVKEVVGIYSNPETNQKVLCFCNLLLLIPFFFCAVFVVGALTAVGVPGVVTTGMPGVTGTGLAGVDTSGFGGTAEVVTGIGTTGVESGISTRCD